MTKLSVNLNKFALVRNSRGTDTPNVLSMGKRCIQSGAHGLTIHPRPDQRHAKYSDAFELGRYLNQVSQIEFNIEGNPIPQFLDVVLEVRPDQCTLVPDAENQLTSDHGWNLPEDAAKAESVVKKLKDADIRVSLFMDADNLEGITCAANIGADRVELYTEPFAKAFGTSNQKTVTAHFTQAARKAADCGLELNAGHDLNLNNLGYFIENVPGVAEVSIGHALVIESWNFGLEETVRKYVKILATAGKA